MTSVLDVESAGPDAALESAARFVLRSGLSTTVLVLRRPGLVRAARKLAESCGLNVHVEMKPITTVVRFSRTHTSAMLG
jgi:hypothetical protein